MSKEKQIEELTYDIANMPNSVDCIVAEAEYLYAKGYRKQSEGENIGTLHPVDEFICSECGIVLEGWSRVVTDEDDSDTMFYEYEFKYCPNCGAKMKGGAE